MDECISKMCYLCTVEYYSAIKKNEAVIHTTTWMTLKNIRLSQKTTYYMISFILKLQNRQIYRDTVKITEIFTWLFCLFLLFLLAMPCSLWILVPQLGIEPGPWQ